jgi:hypothetical protein
MEEEKVMYKIIFTSLGPDKTFTDRSGKEYVDGDVVEFDLDDYNIAISKFYAQDWTQDLETRTKRLVEVAKKTRSKILAKMAKLQK